MARLRWKNTEDTYKSFVSHTAWLKHSPKGLVGFFIYKFSDGNTSIQISNTAGPLLMLKNKVSIRGAKRIVVNWLRKHGYLR